jgi:hypothetical protein
MTEIRNCMIPGGTIDRYKDYVYLHGLVWFDNWAELLQTISGKGL